MYLVSDNTSQAVQEDTVELEIHADWFTTALPA